MKKEWWVVGLGGAWHVGNQKSNLTPPAPFFFLNGRDVTQAVPTYTISYFLLAKGLCEDLESIMRNFWCGKKSNRRKMLGSVGGEFSQTWIL